MKYTAIKKRVCRRVWKDKNGSEWSYMSASSAKEKNVNHRDIVGDIPSKTKGTTVGELYAQDGVHCCPIAEYHEKLKYSQRVKGYIPCRSEEEQEGYVRILGTAWGKVLAPILAALLILAGAILAIWYFTRESGPPLDESAIAYQMPNGLKNESDHAAGVQDADYGRADREGTGGTGQSRRKSLLFYLCDRVNRHTGRTVQERIAGTGNSGNRIYHRE